jgi:hypothetical protein
MLRSGHLLLLGVCSLLLLAGCGTSSYSSSSGIGTSGGSGTGGGITGPGAPYGGGGGVSGSNDLIVATPSVSSVSDVVGTHQTVSITFTSSDGQPITGFGISGNMSGLPAGWTGPDSFGCATVSTGSGCVLNLTYTPTAAANGTLTLGYVFVANNGVPNTNGSFSLSYVATPADNVVATPTPTGQITALKGTGTQSVAVTFTTDDGTVATKFMLTTDLSALPAGWSAALPSFSCATVSTGNGCQLQLTFAPPTLVSGTLVLNYAYTNNVGIAKTGSLNVAYAATENDTVVATPSPMGQINALVDSAGQAVTVTFTTNDGRPASALQLTGGLAPLPAGWRGPATFTCAGVSTGTGCRLALVYAPTPSTAGNGTLALNFSYLNDAGVPGTGSLNIDYRTTTTQSVIGTPNPNPVSVAGPGSESVSITFNTNDGNPASDLQVTTDLGTLPTGWTSSSGTFACVAVAATGNACRLSLTYAPTTVASGTLLLNYSYTDDSGTARTGSVSVPYTATPVPHLYVAELAGSLLYCALNGNGTLAGCTATGSGFTSPAGIAFYGANFAYVADYGSNAVFLCSVDLDGSLSGCAATGTSFLDPFELAVEGTTLYSTNANPSGGITTCTISVVDGTLSGCSMSSGGNGTAGITVGASSAYVGVGAATVDVCAVSALGALSGCAATGSGFNSPNGISLSNGYAYIADEGGSGVSVCTVSQVGGTLSNCTLTAIGVTTEPADIIVNGNGTLAYVDDASTGDVYICPVANGALGACTITNVGTAFSTNQMALH